MGRRKNRWIIAKVHLSDTKVDDLGGTKVVTREAFETELLRLSDILFGSIGGGFVSSATNVVVTSEAESVALFQTKRCFLQKVLCLLRCIDSLQKVPVTLEIIHVGGTLHKCKGVLFANIVETLAQLQALRLAGAGKKDTATKAALSTIGEVYKIRNPTDA
ncbi:hypothetical protein BgAZ_402210 [Babesia gibsoni]|uniref:Uncharacterized protein n=1 Tax=Babesia gibsoni TaxID=33632 RepID=A0AAD8LN33_BABGI|nr:hypothetical protein BgAZ_402210 [Babesia gibsoni]